MNIKSAAELGIQAKILGAGQKAKTHKGRKMLEKKQPLMKENPKRSVIMKGRKSSEILNSLLRELHIMRGSQMSQLLMKKTHDLAPMDDASLVERTLAKYDCSLFVVGNHQKKRPNNLVIGRTFNGHVLDMFEFAVENYKGVSDFKAADFTNDLKPILIFQGDVFDVSDKYKRIKNLFTDFFRITDLAEVNIIELRRVLVFTCRGENASIEVRHMEASDISENTVAKQTVPFREVGPCFDLKLRRDKMAATDLFKEACRQPRTQNLEKKKSNKNKFTTALGETKAKVFLQHQDIDTLALRKFKIGKKSRIQRPTEDSIDPKPKVLTANDV
jgi:ribosome production factor 2